MLLLCQALWSHVTPRLRQGVEIIHKRECYNVIMLMEGMLLSLGNILTLSDLACFHASIYVLTPLRAL